MTGTVHEGTGKEDFVSDLDPLMVLLGYYHGRGLILEKILSLSCHTAQ